MSPISEMFVTNFDHLPVNDLIVTIKNIADKAEKHIAFQVELPEYVTRPPQLRQMADELAQGRDAASGGDRERTAELKAQVAAVKQALTTNAFHIAMLAMHRKDPSILRNSGYALKEKSTRPKVNLLDLVPEVFAKHGIVSGSVIVLVKRANQKATIELQMTDQDPSVEASWNDGGQGMYNRSRIEIKGLEPARRVHFRARYHEDGGIGRWSPSVPLIIL